MKIMALDYGSVTVGVAMTDALGVTAQPKETITRKKENHLRRTLARIVELVSENDIGLIVLGRPLNMDGSAGDRVEACENFKAKLEEKIDIPIVWQDERLTTVEADEVLREMDVPREDRKKYLDSIAASVILRDYMNDKESGEKNGSGKQ